jgi:hypothetical protein
VSLACATVLSGCIGGGVAIEREVAWSLVVEETDPAQLSDEDLLKIVVRIGGKLLEAAQRQIGRVSAAVDDDARWSAPQPFRFDVAYRYLLQEALDAYDVGAGALLVRASPQGFHAVRFQAESFALLRWLTESEEHRVRQERWARVLRRHLERMRKSAHRLPDDPFASAALRRADEMIERLHEIVGQDGLDINPDPPSREVLFDTYDQEGYAMFGLMSELGSHPGGAGVQFFSRRWGERTMDLNLSGALVPRALLAGMAANYLSNTLRLMAHVRGWSGWFDREASGVSDAASKLLFEAHRRWAEMLGPAPSASDDSVPG